MTFLRIENLSVKTDEKQILKNLNFKIGKGEIHALLGANACGKSTLAYSIMGLPNYKITKGKIFFKGKDITKLPPEKRSKLGISLAFQHPPVIKGVKLSKLLEKISKKHNEVEIGSELLEREINYGLSGGERKLSEIIQLFSLNLELVILDEIDSGLDVKKLEKLTQMIKEKLIDDISVLLITHRGDILQFLEPDFCHVMLDGKIICSSKNWENIWETIKRYGYERCKECDECKLSSD